MEESRERLEPLPAGPTARRPVALGGERERSRVASSPAGQFAVSGTSTHSGVAALQRTAGNRAVARLLSAPDSAPRHRSRGRRVQRVTLLVGSNGQRPAHPVHVNDYHFFSRFERGAILGSSQAAGSHSVVLNPFDDFNGLAERAALETTITGTFLHGGISWGWRSAEELYPVADGKACFDLEGEHINELIGLVKYGGQPTQRLKNYAPAAAFVSALPSVQKLAAKGREPDDGDPEVQFPFIFRLANLPDSIKYHHGKPGAGFLTLKGDNLEGMHVHIFFDEVKESPARTVKSLKLSAVSKNHYGLGEGEAGTWQKTPPSQRDEKERKVLMAIVATARRAVDGSSGSDDEKEEKASEKEKKQPERYDWAAEDEEVTIESLAAEYKLPTTAIQYILDKENEGVEGKLNEEEEGEATPKVTPSDLAGRDPEEFGKTYEDWIEAARVQQAAASSSSSSSSSSGSRGKHGNKKKK